MATTAHSVVRKIEALDEDEFHRHFMVILGRLIGTHGQAKVAQALGYTSKRQLANLTNGSLPTLRGFYNLLTLEDTAHDEIDKAYGQKKVGIDVVCSTDPLTLEMIALAHETAEDESDDSPGGTVITDHELLGKDEARLRRVYRTIGGWLDRIEHLRRPRVVGGRR